MLMLNILEVQKDYFQNNVNPCKAELVEWVCYQLCD